MDSFVGLVNPENWPIIGENILATPLLKWLLLFVILFLIWEYHIRKGANCIRGYTTNLQPRSMKKSSISEPGLKDLPYGYSRVEIARQALRLLESDSFASFLRLS
jgi:hypothetical protein